MKNRRVLYAVISVLIILTATFFIVIEEQNTDTQMLDISLYFFNETEETIVAEERQVEYTNEKYLTYAVLNELKNSPKNSKNKPVLDEDVKILSITENNREITVDLSEEFITQDNSKTLLRTYAIVKSLCQLSDVNSVLVTCCGEQITSTDGTVIDFLSDKDIDLVTDTMTKDSKRIVLYFADKNGDCLIAENRTIKITDTNPIEQYIVSELIKGPLSGEAKSVLSQDTELISAQTTDNVCFVNFKSGFIEKNQSSGKFTIYSIVNSLCELDGVDSVQFLVDGKKTEKFGNLDISNAITADKNISK